jgi:hypothetical protein
MWDKIMTVLLSLFIGAAIFAALCVLSILAAQ